MRAAAVQLQSTNDRDRNLEAAERLTRAAARRRRELIVLPERLDIRGSARRLRGRRRAARRRGRSPGRGRPPRELGVDLVAGSIAERREGHERVANTSVHVGPDGELKAVYRKIHMFDVEVGGVEYRESEHSEPADEIVLSETAGGIGLGLTVCYDLRFPELYRILALRGARIVTVPANFTRVTGEAHWEVLLRARAIENQVFAIAPGQGRRPGPEGDSYGNSMIVDPWGVVLARAGGEGECFVAADLDLAPPGGDPREAAEPGEPGGERLSLARGGARVTAAAAKPGAVDKRRMILDAGVRVFARRGFHHCRVSDVADEAGVAYGLVYHYFRSKEEILNTLFLERWQFMLDAIAEIDARDLPAREKLDGVAAFIIDSYRHDPDLMKVIIVEVTRAANSFGAIHLDKIREAYQGIAGIVESAREEGTFKPDIPAEFAAMCFYGAIEQLLTAWIFELMERTDEEYERAKGLVVEAICGGLESAQTARADGSTPSA